MSDAPMMLLTHVEGASALALLDPDTPVPSFEQEVWALNSNARARPLSELLDEWSSVRAASLTMIRGLDSDAMRRAGIASGLRGTVRSLVWMIAGHELHHREILIVTVSQRLGGV